jgi:stearoyl-CoA desaturase (Delta-9 desaturase)
LAVILTFFVAHWILSVFFQTFFLHRYGAHRMFTMSKGWERFFHLCTFFFQGSSYLNPRGYAILHREHHAFSDTERDPHSPWHANGFLDMMWKTKIRYEGLVKRTITPESRFEGGYPEWPLLDRLADSWAMRIAFGTAYTLVYIFFAPHWAWFALLPAHYLMGPIHGAIVNWGGHKVGYRNFESDDKSRNTLVFDFLTLGELFQNNHHKYGMAPSFAVRWFEIDPSYAVIRVLAAVGILQLGKEQKGRYVVEEEVVPALGGELPLASPELPYSPRSLPGARAFSCPARRAIHPRRAVTASSRPTLWPLSPLAACSRDPRAASSDPPPRWEAS